MAKKRILYPEAERQALREQNRRRNYLALCTTAMFSSVGGTMLSYTTVVPTYIRTLTPDPLYIMVITVLVNVGSMGFTLFTTPGAVNATYLRTPWSRALMAMRGPVAISFLSALLIPRSPQLALWVMLAGFAIYSVGFGFSTAYFSALTVRVIGKNMSSFYGSYMLIFSVVGVVTSLFVRWCLNAFPYPLNYQVMFGASAPFAIGGAILADFLVQDFEEPPPENPITTKDILPLTRDFLRDNLPYRRFLILRMLSAVGQMALSFYILYTASVEGATPGLMGTLSIVMLVSQSVFSKVWGWIGEKASPAVVLLFNCFIGLGSIFMVLRLQNLFMSYLLFVLVGALMSGLNFTTTLSSLRYAPKGMVPVMNTSTNVLIMPVLLASSFLGGFLSKQYGAQAVFYVAGVGFAAAAALGIWFVLRTPPARQTVEAVAHQLEPLPFDGKNASEATGEQ